MTAGVLPHPDVVARRLDDSVVLVHLDTNRIFTLNGTGSRIWDLLVAGRSPEEIELVLQREFDVAQEQISMELASLVDELLSEGLILRTDRMAP
jgi:hypothetical protein